MEMTKEDFSKIVENTLDVIRDTLAVKGDEYVRNENPFHNFEEGAIRSKMIREKVLDGFLLKHEVSISDMTNDLEEGILPSVDKVEEKFNDNIIYLILKKAMFLDRINSTNRRNLTLNKRIL